MAKIRVVGIGPGDYEEMTVKAVNALNACDVIVGYHVYVDLVKEHFPDKECFTTPMRREVDRCKMALDMARQGRDVAMICSGDAGIYGMAGLIYELLGEDDDVAVEVIGGLTAATSGGCRLGAPLTHDFAVISLSDLLTPWETIEKRLDCAAAGNFGIVLYNPRSIKRRDYLQRACDIVLKHQRPDTVCGVVRNIGREGEATEIMTLSELRDYDANMFTTVFIGNAFTRKIGGRMVTPRGYRDV
ncbi:MAG: precorrin-3B C(17)-methyltransferase [Clostridia bacterium]|nr:precorrin-3B C(17)-methyltransferase [Clostridia bacterium]